MAKRQTLIQIDLDQISPSARFNKDLSTSLLDSPLKKDPLDAVSKKSGN